MLSLIYLDSVFIELFNYRILKLNSTFFRFFKDCVFRIERITVIEIGFYL